MTDQQKKQKEIAITFARYNSRQRYGSTEFAYSEWLLTEEGKRLTAEEPEPGVIKGIWAVPEEKHRAAIATAQKSEPAYDLLVKISGQIESLERRLKGSLFGD